jgi:hypothetical protein
LGDLHDKPVLEPPVQIIAIEDLNSRPRLIGDDSKVEAVHEDLVWRRAVVDGH